jgi:hypothetical protein
MFLSNINFVDEAIHMRCNTFFHYVGSKTGLPSRRYSYGGQAIRDARNDVNFRRAAYMYLIVLILK